MNFLDQAMQNGARQLRGMMFLLAFVVTSTATGMAQDQNSGSISGKVLDAQGALVAGAGLVLKSNDEGRVQRVAADGKGEYHFDSVKPGTYTLTVDAPSFKTIVESNIQINATENKRLDIALQRGTASEEVTVDAGAVTVDTNSSTIATVIDPTLVQELPIDGNNIVATAALLPGVTDVFAPATFTSDTGGPVFNANGARANQNLFLFDGLYWNNVYFNTGLNFPASQMLQEVSVQLNGFKAEYGRNVGSIFNAVSRSGSNSIHGQVWEYLQNKALNASDYFAGKNPHLVYNQFGGTVGGPIKRERMFFFLGYQDLRASEEVDTRAQTPDYAARGLNADGSPRACSNPAFAGYTCAQFLGQVYNPFYSGNTSPSALAYSNAYVQQINSTFYAQGGAPGTTAPCLTLLAQVGAVNHYEPNNEIPSPCFNNVAQNIQSKYLPYPTPNTNPDGVPFAYLSTKQPRNDQEGLARLDWNRGRHVVDARFYVTRADDLTANGASSTSLSLAAYGLDSNQAGITSGNIGDNWVLTPNISNSLRAGYKRYGYTINPIDTTTLVDLGSNFTNPGHPTPPRLSISPYFTAGSTNSTYSYNVNANFELVDGLSWSKGHHQFKFGAQYLDLQYIHRFDTSLQISSGGSISGNAQSDFLMGLISSLQVGNATDIGAIQHAFYGYGQDDWRLTSKLSLNLGLRYELPKPWYQPNGQSVTFIPGHQSYKFANAPSSLAYQGDPGVPDSIIKTNYTNLAPRVGFVLDAFGNGHLSIHGSFGIFYEALNANTTGFGQPYHYQATYFLPPGSYTTPLGSFTQPTYMLPSVPANYTDAAHAVFGPPISVTFADPNVTEPYTEAFSLGFRQQIQKGVLEMNYVGRLGRHQIIPYDQNPAILDCSGAYFQSNPALYCNAPLAGGGTTGIPGGSADTSQTSYQSRVRYPGFNYGGQGVVDQNSVGTSNYNALQVIYIQRSKRTLTVTASYTYSRSLDDQSSGTTSTNASPYANNTSMNYGPSDFHSTHIANAGWSLHFPELKTGWAATRSVVNGWSFGGIFNARTGHPINLTLSQDRLYNGEPNQRPPLASEYTHYTPLPSNRHRADKIAEWYNACQFADGGNVSSTTVNGVSVPTVPPCGEARIINPGFTNSISRNSLYGPAFIETDLSLRRTFPLAFREGMSFELRADAYNVWNTVNLANPNTTITSANQNTTLSLPGQTRYMSGFVRPNSNAGLISGSVGKSGAGTNGRRVQLFGSIRF